MMPISIRDSGVSNLRRPHGETRRGELSDPDPVDLAE